LAVNAGSSYQGTALDATRFAIYGTPQSGVSLAQLEAGIDAVLTEISNGISADELERAKTRLIADSIYAQDSQSTLARWYGAALASGLTVESVRDWPDRVRTVTADAVRDAAREWLDRRRSVTGYLVKDMTEPAEKRS
jgi:zinc protease